MISIRPAIENDVEALCSLDLIAHVEDERREFIRREVVCGNCFVAVINEKVIGYGVLNYTFYYNGCIDMLYIHSDYRRSGAGVAYYLAEQSNAFTFIPTIGEVVRVQRCYNIWSRFAKLQNCLLRQIFLICRCNHFWRN
jgi:hypothetical protein